MGIVKSKSISADADDDFSHFSVKGSLALVAEDQRIIQIIQIMITQVEDPTRWHQMPN